MKGVVILKRCCLALLTIGFLLTGYLPVNAVEVDEKSPIVKVTMRDIGYTIGDKIVMQAHLRLPENETLDVDSLPLLGPVKSWLDLTALEVVEEKGSATLQFTWQVFATVEQTRKIVIPAITIKTKASNPHTLIIPAQAFYMSPVLPLVLEEKEHRPNLLPLSFSSNPHLLLAAVSFLLAFISVFSWTWWTDRIGWLPRHPGPMTQLSRQLRKQKQFNQWHMSVADLRLVHQALSQAAGETLYPNTLLTLFKNKPYLSVQQTVITEFFNQSWHAFFTQPALATIHIDRNTTLLWVTQAALYERIYQLQTRKG